MGYKIKLRDGTKQELEWFQIQGIKELADKNRALLADEMGMFKTSQAIYAIAAIEKRNNKDLKTLIVCPNSVKPHWEREIWNRFHREPSTYTLDHIIDMDRAEESDFVIANYDLLSRTKTPQSQKRLRQLKKLDFSCIIGDEIHNTKNPLAYRTNSFVDLALKVEYLFLLSGTPIPNSVIDIYTTLHLIDPKLFELNVKNPRFDLRKFWAAYLANPFFVKNALQEITVGFAGRQTKDYLKESMPVVHESNIEIPLKGDNKKIYDSIYLSDDRDGFSKLKLLMQASLDPNILPKSDLPKGKWKSGSINSSKYNALDDLLLSEINKGNKVLIFSSHFKEGIIQKLEQRYSNYRAVSITGDITTNVSKNEDVSERERIRQLFQNDPDIKVLIATIMTMNEGVDLTAANSIIFLDQPYTSTEKDQAIARSKRIGQYQKKNVNVFNLMTTNGDLPTIDQGLEELITKKRQVIEKIMHADIITDYEIELSDHSLSYFRDIHRKKPVQIAIDSPNKVVFEHYLRFRNAGPDKIRRLLKNYPDIAAKIPFFYAKSYELGNDNRYRVAQLVSKTISKLADDDYGIEELLDLACGPATISKLVEKPFTCIDIDPHMLKFAKGFGHLDNIYHEGSITELPFGGNFKVAACSLAYQMLRQKDRKDFFSEVNRVTADGAKLIITLPTSCFSKHDLKRYSKLAPKLGFEKLDDFSGYIFYDRYSIAYWMMLEKTGDFDNAITPKDLRMHQDSLKSKVVPYIKPKKDIFYLEQDSTYKQIEFNELVERL